MGGGNFVGSLKSSNFARNKKQTNDMKENKFAEERFKDINEAYRILSAGNTKRKYDRIWVSKVYKKKQADNKTKRQHISPINEKH